MMKVTTKTKKADLIKVAKEMGALNENLTDEEINGFTTKDLYTAIKLYETHESEKAKAQEQPVMPEQETVVNTDQPINESIEPDSAETVIAQTASTVTVMEPKQSPDEAEIVANILSGYSLLKDRVIELDEQNKKMDRRIKSLHRHESELYENAVTMLNQIANTKNPEFIWVWTLVKEFTKKIAKPDGSAQLILDMERLIVDENTRIREEQELKLRLAEKQKQNEYEETTYSNGTHISYIDGKAVMPSGVKKKIYNIYYGWYEDCETWLSYLMDELTSINKMVIVKKRKQAINALKTEVKTWYVEWEETCEAETVEMVMEIVDTFFNDMKYEKAMSNLVSLIDELTLA